MLLNLAGIPTWFWTYIVRGHNNDGYGYKPETLMEVPASIMPLFGRTQYLRGAVVLTLKHTFLSVGLVSFRYAVTTSVKGPGKHTGKRYGDLR